MDALKMLISTDIGLLSLFTIVFVIGMGGYLYRFVCRHMADEERQLKH